MHRTPSYCLQVSASSRVAALFARCQNATMESVCNARPTRLEWDFIVRGPLRFWGLVLQNKFVLVIEKPMLASFTDRIYNVLITIHVASCIRSGHTLLNKASEAHTYSNISETSLIHIVLYVLSRDAARRYESILHDRDKRDHFMLIKSLRIGYWGYGRDLANFFLLIQYGTDSSGYIILKLLKILWRLSLILNDASMLNIEWESTRPAL